MKKLYLDDVRKPPEGMLLIKSGEELIEYLERNGFDNIKLISFDNDLGEGKMQGYQALDKVIEMLKEIPHYWNLEEFPALCPFNESSCSRKNEGSNTSL